MEVEEHDQTNDVEMKEESDLEVLLREQNLDIDELIRQSLHSATAMLTEGSNHVDRKVERLHKVQELLSPRRLQGTAAGL